MKKFEVKTAILLVLPVLALVGFASLLSLRGMKRDLGPAYRLTKHRIHVGFDSLTEKQKKTAKFLKLTPQNCVLYEIEAESRVAPWLENVVFGESDSRFALNGTSCTELKTGYALPPELSSGNSIVSDTKIIGQMEDYYDLNYLKKADGNIEFSAPLWWTRDGKEFTRKLTKKILPANLKQGVQ